MFNLFIFVRLGQKLFNMAKKKHIVCQLHIMLSYSFGVSFSFGVSVGDKTRIASAVIDRMSLSHQFKGLWPDGARKNHTEICFHVNKHGSRDQSSSLLAWCERWKIFQKKED